MASHGVESLRKARTRVASRWSHRLHREGLPMVSAGLIVTGGRWLSVAGHCQGAAMRSTAKRSPVAPALPRRAAGDEVPV